MNRSFDDFVCNFYEWTFYKPCLHISFIIPCPSAPKAFSMGLCILVKADS